MSILKKISRLTAFAVSLTILLSGCSGKRNVDPFDTIGSSPAPWDLIDENTSDCGKAHVSALETASQSATSDTAVTADNAPLKQGLGRYNRIGRLHDIFNDSNKYQYAAGERIGIRPITSLAEAYYTRRPLVRIESCRWYDLDTLTHSMPYLVPEAASLLETIGRNFSYSLRKLGAEGHKFRVTSVLRTSHSVKRLRRVNRNATDSSTHQLGTTFDISYAHFNHDGRTPRLSDEQLKYVLAEVLYDLRRQNRCMVKFEWKSPCFHITATGL